MSFTVYKDGRPIIEFDSWIAATLYAMDIGGKVVPTPISKELRG